jgi:carbon-monoxide dehydrogenase medium subunit
MYAFAYHRPTSVEEASALLADSEDAKLLAGGQTLIPVMKQRLASPGTIIDLSLVRELSGIEATAGSVVIGAMTQHVAVADSAVVQEHLPALAKLAALVGDPHVRHMGTIGGSLANNDPNADYPAACLALGATIVTTKREIAADAFFTGMFETALKADEIITKVSFPAVKQAAYEKFRNPASRFALVGVFVARRPGDVRVAVTGAGQGGVFRVQAFEQALQQSFAPDAIQGIHVPADGLVGDIHGSAEYRAHLIGVLARRAVAAVK